MWIYLGNNIRSYRTRKLSSETPKISNKYKTYDRARLDCLMEDKTDRWGHLHKGLKGAAMSEGGRFATVSSQRNVLHLFGHKSCKSHRYKVMILNPSLQMERFPL